MRVLTVAAVAVLAAGCGGAPDGAKVFRGECSGCHTLVVKEHGAMGGDLAIPRLGVDDIASFAEQMPTPRPLSHRDARAVAEYVHRQELIRIESGANG